MKKWISGLVVSAAVTGCGVGVDDEGTGVAKQRQAVLTKGALLPAPYIPSTPKLYVPGKTPLYSKANSSAYTIAARSNTNLNEFYAWGFDVMNRDCVFHVRGDLSDYAQFRKDVEAVLESIPMNNPTYVGSGGQGQVGVPRGPGPGGGDLWEEAYRFF